MTGNRNMYNINNINKMKKTIMYVSPEVMKIEVMVEAGFDASGNGGTNNGNDGDEV